MKCIDARHFLAISGLLEVLLISPTLAQPAAPKAPATQAPSPPPKTKLEAFRPAAGSVLILGYDYLGSVGRVFVDVREFRDRMGRIARGLVVEVSESELRRERAFVDADEIPELLKGIDALLEVGANPTKFDNFEVRYTTRGDLQLTAYSSPVRYADIQTNPDTSILTPRLSHVSGGTKYAVRAGDPFRAEILGLNERDLRDVRRLFDLALTKILSVTPKQ
jgi:hypothetical protein